MIVCPGCTYTAGPNTYPLRMAWAEDTPEAIPWWCPSCLAVNMVMEHAVGCRCVGCAMKAAS